MLQSLTHMNVSSNRISRLDSQIFIELPNLLSLDLSHNRPLFFVEQHNRFEENLRCLSLRNTSLTYVRPSGNHNVIIIASYIMILFFLMEVLILVL